MRLEPPPPAWPSLTSMGSGIEDIAIANNANGDITRAVGEAPPGSLRRPEARFPVGISTSFLSWWKTSIQMALKTLRRQTRRPTVSPYCWVLWSAIWLRQSSFGPLNDVTFGVAPLAISPVSSSGLPVTLTSITSAVCTVAGNTVTFVVLALAQFLPARPETSVTLQRWR